MSEIMQFIEATFKPMVTIFTVANLGALGLQVKMPELIAALKNKKGMALIFVWVIFKLNSRLNRQHFFNC